MIIESVIYVVGRTPDDDPTDADMCAYHRDSRWYLLESHGDYWSLCQVVPESDTEIDALVRVARYRHGPSAN